MSSAVKDTGHGASITFGTSALAYSWRKIGEVAQAVDEVEDWDLSSSKKTRMPGDLVDTDTFEIEYAFDGEAAEVAPGGTPETITITAPLEAGQSVAGDLEGSGYVVKVTKTPEYTSNGLQIGKMTIRFDNKTGPAWTPATPSA